jgi:two-component system sensor histidine kinase KdpD
VRPRSLGAPAGEETRLLGAASDQIGQAIERDRLRAESTSAEVARQSDALKSALVDTVSHDFRTPLATIRAAAGNLDHSDAAALIDRQAAYLDRLVTNLLDLSRIDAGQLRASRTPILLDDLVADVVDRLGAGTGAITVEIVGEVPAVLADDVHVHSIVTNLLENARAYARDAPVRIRLEHVRSEAVRLTVEDGGAGVEPGNLNRIFDKFYRGGQGRGSGIGLAVVRGLADAGGATIGARRSELGGLAIDLDLPVADRPVAPAAG